MATILKDAVKGPNFAFTIEGSLEGASDGPGLGIDASGIGDFNGDGIDDLLVSAPGVDVSVAGEDTRVDAGGVFIIFGGSDLAGDVADGRFDLSPDASELAGNGLFIQGERAEDLLTGTGAGDVNGDGLVDIFLTAPSFIEIEVGPPLGTTFDHRPGTGYILYGGASADALADANGTIDLGSLPDMSDGSPAVTKIYGELSALRTGLAYAGGGDVNGDDKSDIVIGTFQANGIFYQPDGTPFDVPELPGAPNPAQALGRVYTLYGDTFMPAEISLDTDIVQGDGSLGFYIRGFTESENDGEGGALPSFFGGIGLPNTLGMADLDGDGKAELLIGSPLGGYLQDGPEDTLYTSGGLFIVNLDGPGEPGPEVLLKNQVFLEGDITGEITFAGSSPSAIGDINNDGIVDIATMAPLLDDTSGAITKINAGAIFGILGAQDIFGPGGLPKRGSLTSDGDFRFFGQSTGDAADILFDSEEDIPDEQDVLPFISGISSVGDFNGDGVNDFAVGFSSSNDGDGAVYLVLGRDGSAPSLRTFEEIYRVSDDAEFDGMYRLNGDVDDLAGFSLGGGVDLNDDGNLEILIGAPGTLAINTEGEQTDGKIYVLSFDDLEQDSNSEPQGAPEISGIAEEGQILSANISSITDSDGINTATEAYQWQRDGADITNATQSTYTLTQADVGTAITLVYSYTDNAGKDESVFSEATDAIANVDDPLLGIMQISGIPALGETLTSNASGLTDADGISELTYYWTRNGQFIQGATQNTYTITQDDVGSTVFAGARVVDTFGNVTFRSGASVFVDENPSPPLIGTPDPDVLVGTDTFEVIEGLASNDNITGGGGNDQIDGGPGRDTAVYSGAQSSYTLTLSPTLTTITDRRANGDGTDDLIDMELLDFASGAFDPFDLTKFGGPTALSQEDFESFIELYIAYFNRAPDAIGLNFWGTAFATGTTLEEMATLFVDQPETVATYPPGTSNNDFAVSVYNNVLGRTPDLVGLEFWVGQLDDGNVSRDQFILEVLRGAKSELKFEEGQDFVDQQLADRAYLENKVDIGAYFAVHKGMSDVDNASAAMALFGDQDTSDITGAVAAIDGFYTDALDPTAGEFLMPLIGVLEEPFVG